MIKGKEEHRNALQERIKSLDDQNGNVVEKTRSIAMQSAEVELELT